MLTLYTLYLQPTYLGILSLYPAYDILSRDEKIRGSDRKKDTLLGSQLRLNTITAVNAIGTKAMHGPSKKV